MTLGTALMGALLALLPATGHDQMWCLYVAGRMIHGVRLYGPELVESNPPLIMWIMLLPAVLAHLLHVPVTILFKAGILLLEAIICAASLHLLQRIRPTLSTAARWRFLFLFIAVFAAMPARDFGQRDHMLTLLCLPYVLAAALDASSTRPALARPAAVLIGVAAGLGIALKPHHLLLPLAIEAARSLKNRSLKSLLRPEAFSLAATLFLYPAAIRLYAPGYLTFILPILRDTYWAFGNLSLLQMVRESLQLHLLAAVTLFLFFRLRWHRSATISFLLIAGIASTAAYYLQGTGWYYQQIPALSFFSLGLWLGLETSAVPKPFQLPHWPPAAALTLCALAIALTAYFSGYTLRQPFSFPSGLSRTPDPSFFTGLAPDTPVAILSTAVDDTIPPIFTRHLLWAQRTIHLWVLPAILRNEQPLSPQDLKRRIPPARLAELDRMQHAWMVEDLARWHPKLILVARCQDPVVHCQILSDRHDDLLAWFARDPAFRAAFSHYRYAQTSGMYDAYTLIH